MSNLKPVIFVKGKYAYNAQNTAQQFLLLKALQVTQDPEKLRQMIGVRTVAEVMRTLDKIVMRKEYHKALAKAGMDFDFISTKLKNEIENADKSGDRLMGINILLKSIGLDKYEESAINGGGWEDILLQIQNDKNGKKEIKEYEVKQPEIPEHIRIAKEKANKESRQLYD